VRSANDTGDAKFVIEIAHVMGHRVRQGPMLIRRCPIICVVAAEEFSIAPSPLYGYPALILPVFRVRYMNHSITHIFGRSCIERGVGSNSSGQFFSSLRVLKSPELGIVFELTSILSRGIGQFIRTTLKAVV